MKRIYKDKIYRVSWGSNRHGYEVRVITGRRVINSGSRGYVIGLFMPHMTLRTYRLDDGHLPEYQPVYTDYQAIADYLSGHPHDEFIEIA